MRVRVCKSLVDPRIRNWKLTALGETMAELRLRSGILVTRHEEEEIPVKSGRITVVPAWRFLLNLPAAPDC